MNPAVGDFFERTAIYLAWAFMMGFAICGWSLVRRWYDPALKENTREALIGLMILMVGGLIHFLTSYVIRQFPAISYATPEVIGALIVRTVAIIAGLLILVRASTRLYCGERGWLWFTVLCILGGTLVDKLMP